MRAISRVLLVAALLLVGLGLYARWRSTQLDAQAVRLAERSREAGVTFASSLERAHHEAELRLLGEKRSATLAAAWWGHGGLFSFGLAVLVLLAAWVAHAVGSFSEIVKDLPDPREHKSSPPRPS